ncbi:MAG: response regulator [Polyangiaceae bacterium]|nr:response regulator [Polyangiaceae bacterium]
MSGSYERPWPTRTRYAVLLVDDDRDMLDTLTATLEDFHDVVATTEPGVALTYIAEREFQVVIADWMMPSMDGIEFFRRVSRIGRPTTCLLISGRIEALGSEVSREDRKMLGLLAKPFSEKQLLERVEQLGRLATMKQTVERMRGTG